MSSDSSQIGYSEYENLHCYDSNQLGHETSQNVNLHCFDNNQLGHETSENINLHCFDNNQHGHETSAYISKPGKSSDYCTYISRPDESLQPEGESDSENSCSQHSGFVNLECGTEKNGRRAVICQLDGNESVDLNESSGTAGRTEVISQLDGNTSIDTSAPDVTNVANLSLPAVPTATTSSTSTRVRNRVTESASLPVIAVINCRSLQPKIRSLVEKFKIEDFSIGILCEIWEKTGKKNRFFQSKVEEMLEIDGLK